MVILPPRKGTQGVLLVSQASIITLIEQNRTSENPGFASQIVLLTHWLVAQLSTWCHSNSCFIRFAFILAFHLCSVRRPWALIAAACWAFLHCIIQVVAHFLQSLLQIAKLCEVQFSHQIGAVHLVEIGNLHVHFACEEQSIRKGETENEFVDITGHHKENIGQMEPSKNQTATATYHIWTGKCHALVKRVSKLLNVNGKKPERKSKTASTNSCEEQIFHTWSWLRPSIVFSVRLPRPYVSSCHKIQYANSKTICIWKQNHAPDCIFEASLIFIKTVVYLLSSSLFLSFLRLPPYSTAFSTW